MPAGQNALLVTHRRPAHGDRKGTDSSGARSHRAHPPHQNEPVGGLPTAAQVLLLALGLTGRSCDPQPGASVFPPPGKGKRRPHCRPEPPASPRPCPPCRSCQLGPAGGPPSSHPQDPLCDGPQHRHPRHRDCPGPPAPLSPLVPPRPLGLIGKLWPDPSNCGVDTEAWARVAPAGSRRLRGARVASGSEDTTVLVSKLTLPAPPGERVPSTPRGDVPPGARRTPASPSPRQEAPQRPPVPQARQRGQDDPRRTRTQLPRCRHRCWGAELAGGVSRCRRLPKSRHISRPRGLAAGVPRGVT